MAFAISSDYFGFSQFQGSRGVSAAAEMISKGIARIYDEMYEIVATENSLKKTLNTLDESVDRCSVANWDDYGARPVNLLSYFYARSFLESLPPRLPQPDVGVDPDGEISFEWALGPRQVFSISVSPNGDLSYAGLYGRNTVHGSESFDVNLPKVIIDNLQRLYAR